MMKGKVFVILGGASGVGAAVAMRIHDLGGNVIVADRKLPQAGGPEDRWLHLEFDLNNLAQCENIFKQIEIKFGRLDGLFCYAGITSPGALLACDEAHFDEIMNTNFKGIFFCCQHAVRLMMRSPQGGSILFTGSPHSDGGDQDRVAYACSKGALFPLMKHLSRHYAEHGIRANLVTMGWMATPGEVALREKSGMSVKELQSWASTVIPAGRMIEVDDIVEGVVYLLSNNSRMVSGSELRVTGGWYI